MSGAKYDDYVLAKILIIAVGSFLARTIMIMWIAKTPDHVDPDTDDHFSKRIYDRPCL